jgi:hypothetical protein
MEKFYSLVFQKLEVVEIDLFCLGLFSRNVIFVLRRVVGVPDRFAERRFAECRFAENPNAAFRQTTMPVLFQQTAVWQTTVRRIFVRQTGRVPL